MNPEFVLSALILVFYASIVLTALVLVSRSKFKSLLADIFCVCGAIASLCLPFFLIASADPGSFDFVWEYKIHLYITGLFGGPVMQFVAVIFRALEQQDLGLIKLNWKLSGISVIAPAVIYVIMVTVGYGGGA